MKDDLKDYGFEKDFRKMMVEKGLKTGEIAKAAGIPQQTLSNYLYRNDISFSKLNKILESVGCELRIVDKDSKKLY